MSTDLPERVNGAEVEPLAEILRHVEPLPDDNTQAEPVVQAEIVEEPDEDADEGGVVLVDRPHTERVDLLSDLAARHADRQPIIAPWLRSARDRRMVVRYYAELQAHRVGYHAGRTHLYGWRLAVMSLIAASVLLIGGILAGVLAPGWVKLLCAAAALLLLGALGVDRDKPVFTRAVLPPTVEPLTSDIVIRGLAATGIPELKKAAEKGAGIDFVAPIAIDGPGWRAEVNLPYGVTADSVIEKRKELATGLRRPLGCVWPEPVSDEHPGRLVLWVGREEMRKSKQPRWPLAQSGMVDLFNPVDYGTDVRGRWVQVTLMYASVIIGSIPRMGKTFLLRLLCLIAALDPRAELYLFDLKGTGDLSPLECVAHRYRAGEEDDDMEYAVTSMRELKVELRRRAKVIRELPKDLCPESKVTSDLANIRHLRLHPIVIAVDECQVWFEHPVYGKELEAICTDIVKRGPALGMVPLYATQRPDAKSLPTGISANAVLRFALKVMGHTENDMVLGSGMNKSGVKAQTFTRKDLGIHYLAGEGDDPRIVRGVYVDAPAAEQIAMRAREMREAVGTLSGYALGENVDLVQERSPYDLLEDILAITSADEEKVWNSVAVDRLVELRPEVYGQWADLDEPGKTAALTARLKEHGVTVDQVWGTTDAGEGKNRRGFVRADVAEVVAQRKRR